MYRCTVLVPATHTISVLLSAVSHDSIFPLLECGYNHKSLQAVRPQRVRRDRIPADHYRLKSPWERFNHYMFTLYTCTVVDCTHTLLL